MLQGIQDQTASILCNQCQTISSEDLTDRISPFLEEFLEYENFLFVCPSCGGAEIFNMNIPVNDTDEPFMTGELSEEEEIQRYYVRILIRLIREDFKNQEGIT